MEVMTKYNEAQVDFRERSKGRIQRQLEISMCLRLGQCLSLSFPVVWLFIPSPGRSNSDPAACAFCILFGAQTQGRCYGIGISARWYPRLEGVPFVQQGILFLWDPTINACRGHPLNSCSPENSLHLCNKGVVLVAVKN